MRVCYFSLNQLTGKKLRLTAAILLVFSCSAHQKEEWSENRIIQPVFCDDHVSIKITIFEVCLFFKFTRSELHLEKSISPKRCVYTVQAYRFNYSHVEIWHKVGFHYYWHPLWKKAKHILVNILHFSFTTIFCIMHLAERGGFQHYEKLASLFTQQSDLRTTTEPVKYKSIRARKRKKHNRFPYISARGGSRNMAWTGGEGTKSIQRNASSFTFNFLQPSIHT